MKRLLKTINGEECEVYTISHHNRLFVGKTKSSKIEIYENSIKVPTVGANSVQYKRTYFSIAICPDPEMDAAMTDDLIKGLISFDLSILIQGKDGIFSPLVLYGVSAADLSQDRWVFEITDAETVRKLLTL